MMGLKFLLVVVALTGLADATDYCKNCRNLIPPRRHVMCAFPSTEISSKCAANVTAASLTLEEKRQILDTHNNLRKYVSLGNELRGRGGGQPAGIIPPLKWDDELATIAQRQANQCHSIPALCSHIDRFPVGQIEQLFPIPDYLARYPLNVSEAVESWYNDVEKFNRKDVSLFKKKNIIGPRIGRYPQIVWGNTTHVGCGILKYKKNTSFMDYLVCNYGPAGRIVGQPVYQTKP